MFMKRYLLSLYLFFHLSLLATESVSESLTLNTLYGQYTVTEPVIIELIQSSSFQRLKDIHQYGTLKYVMPLESYNRYEHSIGVFVILRKFGASLEEQIAGLLHDVSHTAFSHVGDHVFQSYGDNAYQDDIHTWFITHTELEQILDKYKYTPYDINPKNGRHQMLDKSLPDMCADRIEYNIIGGVKRDLMSKEEAETVFTDLHFEEGVWYFEDPHLARLLANMSLNMTLNLWGSSSNGVIYIWTADAIKRGLEIGLFTFEDFHFSVDDIIWNKLLNCTDPYIQDTMYKLLHYTEYYELVDVQYADIVVKCKFRGINPLVKIGNTFFQLTELDENFKKDFEETKKAAEHGWGIKLINPVTINL